MTIRTKHNGEKEIAKKSVSPLKKREMRVLEESKIERKSLLDNHE